MFRIKGYDGTSVRDIADGVGILKGSIYHYIEAKEGLLYDITMRGINLVIPVLEEIISKNISSTEKIKACVRSSLNYVTTFSDESAVWLNEKDSLNPEHLAIYTESRNRVEKIFRTVIQEGIEKGEFNHFNPKLATFAVLGMCNWVISWYKPEGSLRSEDIIDEFVAMVEEMLVAR